MKKLFLLLFILFSVNIFAQKKANFCQRSTYLKASGNIENEKIAYDALLKKASEGSSRGTITVPIVFHVLYKKQKDNVPDSIILKTLKILNEDFQAKNEDLKNLRPTFKNVAGNTNVEFKLHKIIRKKTNTNFGYDNSDTTFYLGLNLLETVKFTSKGGSDPLDPERFLNVWICKIGVYIDGVYNGDDDYDLAYALPPLGHPQWLGTTVDSITLASKKRDGVVISKNMLGELLLGSDSMPVLVKNRTLSHEVGHYLGLRHIFGEDSTDCKDTDLLKDTPTCQFSGICSDSLNSCTDSLNDMPDLWENYMDYSTDDCKNMFTKQQAALMQACLEIYRPKLREEFVAVNDDVSTKNTRIYPNPSSQTLNIDFSFLPSENSKIEIYNTFGQLISKEKIQNSSLFFDVSNWKSSFYILKIYKNEKEVEVLKFLKQ